MEETKTMGVSEQGAEDDGENCITRSFITFTLRCQVKLE
jgi:hypothetical protein